MDDGMQVVTPERGKARTKRFAVEMVRFCARLPKSEEGHLIARRRMRAATSIGANDRAAQRGRSKAEFAARPGSVIEEADECGYRLELLDELGAGDAAVREHLRHEADELRRIIVAATERARSRS